MRVVSLFDGISCGMVALKRARIPVESYIAYETEPNAIKVSSTNYPMIEQKGDVFVGKFKKYKGYDLLIGGSPCTFWSSAKKDRETTPDGLGAKYFMEYVRALKEIKPKYFIYENNYSISSDVKSFITKHLGVEPITINSNLVSAQDRRRCYWTNIPNIKEPKDKGRTIKDIVDSKASSKNFQFCSMRGRKNKDGIYLQHIELHGNKSSTVTTVTKDVMICEKITTRTDTSLGHTYKVKNKKVYIKYRGKLYDTKTYTHKIDLADGYYQVRYISPLEAERLQTLPDNYTSSIPKIARQKCIGNGWTVDVIAHILRHIPKEDRK